MKTPERRHWRRSGVFIVNFEHISQLFLVTYDQHFSTCLSDWYWDSCWKLEVKWTYFQSVLLNINIEIIYLVRTQNFLKD